MSRRSALIVAVVAALVFAVVYFWPEKAVAGSGFSPSVTGRLHLGDRAVLPGARTGAVERDRWKDRRDRRGHHRHRKQRPLIVLQPGTTRIIERETVIIQPPAAAPPPAPPVAKAPPPPPDPHGRARTLPARGATGPREWALGDTLPHGVPHVTLDPVAYGLPRPPDGQLYARVGGDVLRIEAGSRRILGVLAR